MMGHVTMARRTIRAFLSVDDGSPSEMTFVVPPKLGDQINSRGKGSGVLARVVGIRHALGPDGAGALLIQAQAV